MSTDGTIVVRRTEDYIPSMIELAGGRYVFQDLTGAEATSSSVSLSMEEFYAAAKDADYLVYNATIDNPISSVDELLAKNELFADFKAVRKRKCLVRGQIYVSGDGYCRTADPGFPSDADRWRSVTDDLPDKGK